MARRVFFYCWRCDRYFLKRASIFDGYSVRHRCGLRCYPAIWDGWLPR